MARLDELFTMFGSDDRLAVIGASINGSIETAGESPEAVSVGWIRCVVPPPERVALVRDYGLEYPSYTFLIGSDGKILAKNPGQEMLLALVEQALGENR